MNMNCSPGGFLPILSIKHFPNYKLENSFAHAPREFIYRPFRANQFFCCDTQGSTVLLSGKSTCLSFKSLPQGHHDDVIVLSNI